jgi:hypothetical protein
MTVVKCEREEESIDGTRWSDSERQRGGEDTVR